MTSSTLRHKQLIFLVGVPRSGTTWLQTMLCAHSEIASSQESHLFNHFLTPMIKTWQNILSFKDGRGGIGLPTYFTQDQFEKALRTFTESTLKQVDEFNHCRYFIEKTPDHLVHIKYIHQIFPQAKFIYLKRNAFDVIESLLAAGKDWGKAWAPKTTFKAIRLFNNYRKQGEQQLEQIPQQLKIEVDYETMLRSPHETLEQICQFIQVEYNDGMLQNMSKQKSKLKRYGEFGKINGCNVQEPSGFRRKKKLTLNLFQRYWIKLAC